jgi:septal ring factor EnvC (AmiA/AmiB activator)
MARTKSITTIENEIAKIQSELTKIRKKEDALADRLLVLQKEKQDYEAKQIIDAYKRSGKTLHEMMVFLGA